MRDLRRIDVLLNETTGERFDRDGIVKIITDEFTTYRREYVGRIICIDTLQLTLDMSKEYKNNVKEIKYEEIDKIEKLFDPNSEFIY
jgi:hypothetical protein